jgi:UDP-2,3-diacylglucosamine pyrophosphatase LpxH
MAPPRLTAVHGTKHEVDLEQAQRKCAASRLAAARKASLENQWEHRAQSMCREGISDWMDTNKEAYRCCWSTAKADAIVHGHLPKLEDMVSSCHPKDLMARMNYRVSQWF